MGETEHSKEEENAITASGEKLKELCVHNKPQTTKKSCGAVLRCFVANC